MEKASKLQLIQEPVQEIAEAIASALKLDVEIFDKNLVVVGATGRIRGKIGFTSKTANVTRQAFRETRDVEGNLDDGQPLRQKP